MSSRYYYVIPFVVISSLGPDALVSIFSGFSYPLYQRGNPQLRVFLPNFWMKLVKSEEPLPPNVVLFQTSIQMTKYDIKNYLEKIYKVPVIDVKTTIKMGNMYKNFFRKCVMKDEDYKEALVYLPKNYNFEFPDIVKPKNQIEMQRYKKLKEEYKKNMKSKISFLPKWFSGD